MILYELITGALPFESIQMRQAGFSELCRIIQEETPPKPSTRLLTLGGEASKWPPSRTRPADLAGMLKRNSNGYPSRLRKARDERYESAVAAFGGHTSIPAGRRACRRTRDIDIQTQVPASQSQWIPRPNTVLTLLVGLCLRCGSWTRRRSRISPFRSRQIKRIQEELQAASLRSEEELAKKKLEQEETAKINRALITTQKNSSRSTTSRIFTASLLLNPAIKRMLVRASHGFNWATRRTTLRMAASLGRNDRV